MAIRLVQVGMGGWGQSWLNNVLRRAEGVEVVAHVDPSPAALARVRTALGVPPDRCFATLEEALAAADADAVLITAAVPAHVPVALAALEAGKHVLLEKPFAPTQAEAQRVVDVAAERGHVLMISQNYRFYPAVRAVAALVREGALGPVGAVNLDFRRYANRAAREGHRHYTIQHPMLMDMAIHHFDLMRAILGQEATEIMCHAWNPPWSNFDDPAAAVATISFDGGTVVSYRGSWVSPGPQTTWAGEWRMECADGQIDWTSRDGSGTGDADRVTLRRLDKRARHVELPALPQIDRAGSLAALVEAVRTGQEPESSGRDNLGSIALMNAAIESATSGRPVAVVRRQAGGAGVSPASFVA